MLICPDRKFIFFKPLKCAGTSIEHALYSTTGINALCTGSNDKEIIEYVERNNTFQEDNETKKRFIQHSYPSLFYSRIVDPVIYSEYTNITVIRNPWDALVSYYWWCVDKGDGFKPEVIIHHSDTNAVMQQKFENAMTCPAIYKNDIIAHELGIGNEISSAFIFFHKLGNKFIDHRIDKYLCFENLDKDFRFLCKDLMLPKIKLPQHKTKIKRLKIDYTCYYNDWMRDIVASKFSSYIQKFNYKFGC